VFVLPHCVWCELASPPRMSSSEECVLSARDTFVCLSRFVMFLSPLHPLPFFTRLVLQPISGTRRKLVALILLVSGPKPTALPAQAPGVFRSGPIAICCSCSVPSTHPTEEPRWVTACPCSMPCSPASYAYLCTEPVIYCFLGCR